MLQPARTADEDKQALLREQLHMMQQTLLSQLQQVLTQGAATANLGAEANYFTAGIVAESDQQMGRVLRGRWG